MDLGSLSKASVSYDDLVGSVAVDFEGDPDNFESYVSSLGIDLKKYTPIGIEFYGGDTCMVTVLCHKKENQPLDRSKPIPVVAIEVKESIDNFFKHLKNIQILLLEKWQKPESIIVEQYIDNSGKITELKF